MEILKEEVGFKLTISVFEAFVTSSPNYIAVMVWGFATKRNYFKVCSVKILVTLPFRFDYLQRSRSVGSAETRLLHLALACGRHNQTRPYRQRSPDKQGIDTEIETIQAVIRSVKLD